MNKLYRLFALCATTVLIASSGCQGDNGTSCSVADNGDGTATISCDDGTSTTVSDGVDGSSCTATDNGDGSSTITCDDGTTVTVADGVDGDSCTVADNGDGTKTISCDDGTSVTVADGADGDSCTVVDNGNGTHTISCEDGTSVTTGSVEGTAYDFAYISDFSLGPTTAAISSWAVLINRGTVDLDLSTASIVAQNDDHPTADMLVGLSGTSGTVPFNTAQGNLSPAAQAVLIPGVVPESWTKTFSTSLVFSGSKANGDVFHYVGLLRVNGVDMFFPITVHIENTSTLNVASRLSTN